MRRGLFCSLVAVLFIGVTGTPATAWHARGHMTVALIAYRQLEEPQKKQIRAILTGHPPLETILTAKKPADATMEEWMVMRAAIWPDLIRGDEDFDKPFHHYVNMPIRRLDGATEAQKEKIEQNIAALPNDEESGVLLRELPLRMKEVRTSTDPAQRAIALCWVLHLVGDIHQPLHAAAVFGKKSFRGDRGGNASFVRWNGRAEKLHAIWDGVLGWDEFPGPGGPKLTEFEVVDLMARHCQASHPVTAAQLEITSIDDWAKESRDLADKEAYSSNGVPISIVFNFDRHHYLTAADVDPLPDGYQTRAQGVAEKRVALAGARLVGRLKEILP
jgi:hypothetical protein